MLGLRSKVLLFSRLTFSFSYSKIQSGLAAFERNTGNVHPAASGFQGSFTANTKRAPLEKIDSVVSKRATAAEPLTDSDEDLWFGTITVGTPPQTFTGQFISVSAGFGVEFRFTVDIDTGTCAFPSQGLYY